LPRGTSVEFTHFGEKHIVAERETITLPIDPIHRPPTVHQPKGRAPDEIKTTGTHLDETGALLQVEGDYPHQTGSAV
jgi:hypothetical protein